MSGDFENYLSRLLHPLTMAEALRKPLRFTTHEALAHRLVLATLTGRAVHISNIRPSSASNPGLAPHEISFLRLLEAVTTGSHIEISYTGTTILYRPGLIVGNVSGSGESGGVIRHEIPASCTRGVSYFLIPLCMLAPFSKTPLNVVFTGPGVITSATAAGDVSIDSVRAGLLPTYAQFDISDNIELRILRRSSPGLDGRGGIGEVQLIFGHQVRLPKTVHLLNAGRIKKIRGVAYCTGVSVSNNTRMIEAAKGVLNLLAIDTYIFSDVSSALPVDTTARPDLDDKRKVGVGFGLSLVAESSTGCLYSADTTPRPSGGQAAEEIGIHCAFQLLETISAGGTVSLLAAPTVLTLMAMGSEDVGRLQLNRHLLVSRDVVGLGRDLKAFGANAWAFREGPDGPAVVSIVGRGINLGRKIT